MVRWRPKLPKPSIEAQAAVGVLIAALNIVSTVLAILDVARLPLTVIAAVAAITFVAIFVSVILRLRSQIVELRTRLDTSAAREVGLMALNQRIIEGNELARKLSRYLPAEPATTASLDEDKDGFTQMVAWWNRDCWETVHTVLPYMAGSLDAPVPHRMEPPRRRGTIRLREIYWQENLLHEVTVKIERLQAVQARVTSGE